MSDTIDPTTANSNFTPPEPGYFQTIEYHPSSSSDDAAAAAPNSPTTITIHDSLYGSHTITEPVLVSLLQSPALLRLSSVCQHGITGLLGLTPRVTRLEHSIGAFLLVRRVHGTLAEQVAALLHDVSHTALSHVVDWALSTAPGNESFHEVHKTRFIRSTSLPAIITRHGLTPHVFDEDAFPLVESPAPHLCADRLDYALRDGVAFGKLDVQDARRVFASLSAHPDVTSPRRLLVLTDQHLALTLARAYLATDRDVWSNPAHINVYQRAGRVIGDAIRAGAVREDELWSLSDGEFWEALRGATDEVGKQAMWRLEVEGLPRDDEGEGEGQGEDSKLGLPVGTKVRTLDPDVCCRDPAAAGEELVDGGSSGSGSTCQSLSVWCPAWAAERTAYILARKKLQRPSLS